MPIATIDLPSGLARPTKQRLVTSVADAIHAAYPLPSGKRVTTRWVLCFFHEMTLEQASLDELMAFENPMVLEGMEAAMQAARP